jgi:hypothetical protein
MRLPIQGKKFAGKVDQIPGVLYVATRFEHVFTVPIIPLASYILLEDTGEGGGTRGRKIGLSYKSLLAAYGRPALLLGGVSFALLGLMLLVTTLLSLTGASPLAIVVAFLFGGAGLGGYFFLPRLLRASPKRAMQLAEIAGIDLAQDLAAGVELSPEGAEQSPDADGEEAWRAEGYEEDSNYVPEPDAGSYAYGAPTQSTESLYVYEQETGLTAGNYYDEPVSTKAAKRRILGLTIPQFGIIAVLLIGACIAVLVLGRPYLGDLPALLSGDGATAEPAASPLPTATEATDSTATPIPPPLLAAGWTLRERPGDGLMVGLPSRWVELDIHADSMDEALTPLKECCPELDLTTPYWTDQSIIDLQMKGLKLFAIDPEIGFTARYFAGIDIVHRFYDDPWTLDDAVEELLQEYEAHGTQVTHRRVALPVGEAVEFEYVEGVEHPLYVLKYLLIQDDTIWFITMTCEETYEEDYTPIFTQIPQTFRWMDVETVVPTLESISPSCPPGATFVADVTIPDGTELAPGEAFAKTWRIRSSGCAPWPAGSQLVFVSGDGMGGSGGVEVAETPLGETADITVQLTAPEDAGTYKGYWQMQAPDGTPFGDQFYVMIVVR